MDKGRGARGEESTSSSRPSPKVIPRPPNPPASQPLSPGVSTVPPPPNPSSDSELHPYSLPSYCDLLFTALRGLQGEGLLTDCDLQLHGNPFRFHWVVLAAGSERVEAWLRAGKAGLNEALRQLSEGHVTAPGLGAVLDFAYAGEMVGTPPDTGALEDVMSACRCRF